MIINNIGKVVERAKKYIFDDGMTYSEALEKAEREVMYEELLEKYQSKNNSETKAEMNKNV